MASQNTGHGKSQRVHSPNARTRLASVRFGTVCFVGTNFAKTKKKFMFALFTTFITLLNNTKHNTIGDRHYQTVFPF